MRIRKITLVASLLFIGAVQAAHSAEKTVNLSVNPLGLAFGAANMNADFAVSESLTFGPSISYASFSATGLNADLTTNTTTGSATGFGVNMNWFMGNKALTDSWFLNPFVMYAKASSSQNLSASGTSFGANIGYWWFWESGINLGLGLGIQKLNIDLATLGLGSISGTLPSAMFQFGYAF